MSLYSNHNPINSISMSYPFLLFCNTSFIKAKLVLKKIFGLLLFLSGIVSRKINQLSKTNFFVILMYHRITSKDDTIQPGMYVNPKTFEKHLIFLNQNFTVVPLSYLSDPGKIGVEKNKKPICILTFDDGWKDFYDYAFPLLLKYSTPATVFLPTKFIGSKVQFWTDCFSSLLSLRRETTIENLSDLCNLTIIEDIDGLNGTFEQKLEKGIECLKKYPLSVIKDVLTGLSEIWQVDIDSSVRYFLNWSEISEMMSSGLVSFGSHTVNHQILTTLNDVDIKKELIDSKKELSKRNVVDTLGVSFCYPNGNHTKEIADEVRSSGYQLAVTTKKGWNHLEADKFTLKRVGIHDDISSTTSLFACRVAGLI